VAVKVALRQPYAFLDIASPRSHATLTRVLAQPLSALGVDNLDTNVVSGRDRRITRLIAAWALEPDVDGLELAGVRYISRLGEWECWAVREDALIEITETHPVTRDIPELQHVATQWDLTVF